MKDKRGFTLIELVIVLALLGIILSLIFTPITFAFKNFGTQNEKTNIISTARYTMDYLTREIRKSGSVEIDGDDIKIGTVTYKLQNRILYKDDSDLIEGIDELNIDYVDNDEDRISIEIIIRDSANKEHKISSIINIR